MPIGTLMAADSWLFMWVTEQHMPDALRLAEAWGFTYEGKAFVWHKLKKDGTRSYQSGGLSRSTQPSTEAVLLFKRGNPKTFCGIVREDLFAPRVGPHSSKPDAIRHKIVRFAGNVPRIELFARYTEESTCTEGWDWWGDGDMGDGKGHHYDGTDRFHKSETPGQVSAKPKEDSDPPCPCEKAFGVECPEAAARLHALMDKQKTLPKRIDVNNLPADELKEALTEAGVTPEFASAVVTERETRRKKSMEKKKKKKKKKSKWKKKHESFVNLPGLLSVRGANGGDLESIVTWGCYC